MSNQWHIHNLLNHHHLTLDTPKLMKSLTPSPNNLHYSPNHSEQPSHRQTTNSLKPHLTPQNQATIQEGQIVIQNVQGQHNQNQRYFAWGNGVAGFGGTQNRAGNANAGQGKPIKCYTRNEYILHGNSTIRSSTESDILSVQDAADASPKEWSNECDAFDSDVEDEPTAQSIFMANLSSAGPTNHKLAHPNASRLI
ncbi:hypothetical protein Tco_0488772 [Tanacetum coccineum]